MPCHEAALHINGPQGQLLGILSTPTGANASATGVVIVVGGAQYRVGSHRQFVHLARHLAGAGHAVLRFDLSGMGDSPGIPQPFEAVHEDVQAAIRALQQHAPGVERVVLWGLCDGASAALLYLQQEAHAEETPASVAGVVMLNPWVRSEASLAKAQVKHYYRQRLLDPAFWRKLLGGGIGRRALSDLWGNLRRMRHRTSTAKPTSTAPLTFQQRMAAGLSSLQGAALVLLSERDLTAQEFQEYTRSDPVWQQLLAHPRLEQHTLPGADHTCSTPGASALVEQLTLQWLSRL